MKKDCCTHLAYYQYTVITVDGPQYLVAYCTFCKRSYKLTEVRRILKRGRPKEGDPIKHVIGFKQV